MALKVTKRHILHFYLILIKLCPEIMTEIVIVYVYFGLFWAKGFD
jgi:hypothetical protein